MRRDKQTALQQDIGLRVRALRKERAWKQQVLAEMIGDKSHSTIGNPPGNPGVQAGEG